jgi:hypothetical protein
VSSSASQGLRSAPVAAQKGLDDWRRTRYRARRRRDAWLGVLGLVDTGGGFGSHPPLFQSALIEIHSSRKDEIT